MSCDCYSTAHVADLQRQLECARADLKATRAQNDRHCLAIDDYVAEIARLRKQLAAATGPQEVVLTGWHSMTMTTDHRGTVLRRTS